ncbi:MAG: hypothetical protein VST70_09760 [Nitrospirota bacterium]|nr:hypothetical protein [Nitrospirota bacterium]
MDSQPSLPNMIVNYSIIIVGMIMMVFIISASFYMIVRREKILNKRFPEEDKKVDPWGYPLEEPGKTVTGKDSKEKRS